MIRAEITGSTRCTALGFVGQGDAPVLALCRLLVAAGYDPGTPLHAYRGDVLALRVRSIGEAAQLQISSDPPRFRKADTTGSSPAQAKISPEAA